MVDIQPFKATIINPEMMTEKLICPVYDTIDEDYSRYAKEKNNIIHLTTRRKNMKLSEFIENARNNLLRLRRSGILVERKQAGFYIYGIMFTLPQEILAQLHEKDRKEKYFVFGLVALVRVEELGEGIVGHENIFEINTKERYELMKACMMNFSPITAEYSMSNHDLNNLFEEYLGLKRPEFKPNPKKSPIVDVTLDGFRHLLWEITDSKLITRITEMMAGLKILILDGHHRYTASNLMKERDGIEYTMMMLMEGGDKALLLLPWHRTVRNFSNKELDILIKQNFSVEWQSHENNEEFYSLLHQRKSRYEVKLGMYDGEKFSILKANENAVHKLSEKRGEAVGLDLIVLHEWLIDKLIKDAMEDVFFNASPSEAIARVDKGEFKIAFLLNPMSIQDVEKKAFEERKNFPQKSTLFIPKVAEGIVMRRIELPYIS